MDNDLHGAELNIDDPNLVCDDRVRVIFKVLLAANLRKNDAIKIYDQKLQFVAQFLLHIRNDKEARESTRANAKQAMEYLGIRLKKSV